MRGSHERCAGPRSAGGSCTLGAPGLATTAAFQAAEAAAAAAVGQRRPASRASALAAASAAPAAGGPAARPGSGLALISPAYLAAVVADAADTPLRDPLTRPATSMSCARGGGDPSTRSFTSMSAARSIGTATPADLARQKAAPLSAAHGVSGGGARAAKVLGRGLTEQQMKGQTKLTQVNQRYIPMGSKAVDLAGKHQF